MRAKLFTILSIFIFSLFLAPHKAAALTTISTCQRLNIAAETYVLQNDLSANGDCLIVTQPGIYIDLNGYTINGNISGNGSSTLNHSHGWNFTVVKGRINGNLTTKGLDGLNGAHGAAGANGVNGINDGGDGSGGLGGLGGSGSVCGVDQGNGEDGFPSFESDEIGGTGGGGGHGEDGCNGNSGATIVVSGVYVNGYIDSSGGRGGNGGNGGRGGNGGLPSGNGGVGGNAGSGGNGSFGGQIRISTSTVTGFVRANAGGTGNGGNGGNGGDGIASAGIAGGPGYRGAYPANGSLTAGSITVYESLLMMPIEREISPCGTIGVDGVPGSGIQDTYPEAYISDLCHSGGGSVTSLTVADSAPTITMVGENTVTIAAGAGYIDQGATATDLIDGTVPVSVTGVINPNVAGTYTLTYSATDKGTTYTVNGVQTTFQVPQTVTTTRTLVVTGTTQQMGGTGGGGYTPSPGFGGNTNGQNQTQNATPTPPTLPVGTMTLGDQITKSACATWINKNILYGQKNNDPAVVEKLQIFLNTYQNANLKTDGKYGPASRNQVNKFQVKFQSEILKPLKLFGPTGNVMASTRAKMNAVACELAK